jgi:CBS domain containing-hemolysin-like protein
VAAVSREFSGQQPQQLVEHLPELAAAMEAKAAAVVLAQVALAATVAAAAAVVVVMLEQGAEATALAPVLQLLVRAAAVVVVLRVIIAPLAPASLTLEHPVEVAWACTAKAQMDRLALAPALEAMAVSAAPGGRQDFQQ